MIFKITIPRSAEENAFPIRPLKLACKEKYQGRTYLWTGRGIFHQTSYSKEIWKFITTCFYRVRQLIFLQRGTSVNTNCDSHFITKCDNLFLQSEITCYFKVRQLFITKCDKCYYKLRQLFYYKVRQLIFTKCDSLFIIKWDNVLFQSATVILLQSAATCFYKVRQ